jgi:hypothetical protein
VTTTTTTTGNTATTSNTATSSNTATTTGGTTATGGATTTGGTATTAGGTATTAGGTATTAKVTPLATGAPVPSATATRVPTATPAPATATPTPEPADEADVAAEEPDSATNATSGNAAAAAGQAQTTSNNTQLSAGTAGGGSGALIVTNGHAGTVTDVSSASAKSGIAVALAPTVAPGTAVPKGVTVASSGSTTAAGIQAQNNVSNTSLGAVQVKGANEAPVTLSSMSTADVTDVGASGATSGAAWAVAAGAAGSPSGVATPAAAHGAPTSDPASATGLTALNNVSSTVTATMTTAGGNHPPTPITLNASQTANITAGGEAQAVSGAACAAGATCAAANQVTAALAAPAAALAASGAASAQGLAAQNTVNTNATVAVHVGGQNFAPIQVIVDSVTQIFNLGAASATSGDATAGAGGTTTTAAGQTAASGSAQATGAQVQNTVNLRSSAAVHVAGDNYDPISLMLNLAANLVNWGTATAISGDAQSTGATGGTATSGAAAANGLQAMNLVNMWADASVDIDGNNYAPIFVHISFNTTIQNYGVAQATTGHVAAGQATSATTANTQTTTATSSASPTTANNAAGGSNSASSSGSVGRSSHAEGGNTVAVANSVNANIASVQLASANGGKPIASDTLTHMLRNLPSGSWNPYVENNLPANTVPAVQDGLASRSGDAVSIGLQSQVNLNNTQVAACHDPASNCVAGNSAVLSVAALDSPTNLATGGPGSTTADAGGSLANATPTPTPSPTSTPVATSGSDGTGGSGGGGGGGGGGDGGGSRHNAQNMGTTLVAADLIAQGHVVVVDLWDQWPGRRLPPMPNPNDHAPVTTTVSAALDNWPGADELPLPDVSTDDAQPEGQAVAGVAAPAVPRVRLLDSATGADDDDEFPMLVIADLDPWGPAPATEGLPLPDQAPRLAAATTAPATPADNLAGPVQPDEPNDPGAAPVAAGLAALLSAVAGLVSLRRGRLLMSTLRGLGGYRPAWPSGLGRQTQRALAIIRLTLGILRLW